MKKRALLIALATSAVGAGLIQLYLHRLELEVSGGVMRPVLFVRRDVPAGSVLTEDAVGERGIPQSYLSPRHVLASDLNRVVGTRVSAGIGVNDALMWTDLAVMRQDKSLADLIQDGMRAVSLRAAAFDGLMRPGDRVDVVFVSHANVDLKQPDGKQLRATTLLQNILVLAVGGHMSRETASDNRHAGQVTLLVTVEQAEMVKLSSKQGDMELILRNPGDVTVRDEIAAVTTDDLRDPVKRARFVDAADPAKQQTAEVDHVQ